MQVEVERIILLQEAQEELSYLLTTTPYEFEQKLLVHTVQGLKLRMQFIHEYTPSSETQGQQVGRRGWAKVYNKNGKAPVVAFSQRLKHGHSWS